MINKIVNFFTFLQKNHSIKPNHVGIAGCGAAAPFFTIYDIAKLYFRSRDMGISPTLGTSEMTTTLPRNEENIILKRLDHYKNKRETAVYV